MAFIGLNGSGKSQLLELIGETFAYLEHYQRTGFKTRPSLGFLVSVTSKFFSKLNSLIMMSLKLYGKRWSTCRFKVPKVSKKSSLVRYYQL